MFEQNQNPTKKNLEAKQLRERKKVAYKFSKGIRKVQKFQISSKLKPFKIKARSSGI